MDHGRGTTEKGRSIWRWILIAVVTTGIVALFTAPLGSGGVCGASGECRTWQTTILSFPVTEWLWIGASIAALVAVLGLGLGVSRRSSGHNNTGAG